jgi:hypothetical protein
MKSLLPIVAAGLFITLAGCQSTGSSTSAQVAPGAVSSGCCEGERLGSEGCCKAAICEENAAKKARKSAN